MAKITLKGNPIQTGGQLPAVGATAPDATLTGIDLADKKLSSIPGVTVLNISMDLPFALKRFCGAEGIDKALSFSGFRGDFGQKFGVTMTEGSMTGLFSRAIVVLDESGKVIHSEQVPEIAQEPNYDAALAKL